MMRSIPRCGSLLLAAMFLAGMWADNARGRDWFLTIGGGYAPSGNQASLEKNVLYFQRVLLDLGEGDARHDIFFADGSDPGRDLQFVDPAQAVPPANRYLAMLFQQEDGIDEQFRSHSVSGVQGPANRASLDRWFEEVAPQLAPGDRLVVYFTGHGGKGPEVQKSHMHLWNHEKLAVDELVERLDKLPADVAVVLVMVQCYSGSFAQVIFEHGKPDDGVSPSNRCGFFATVHDRVAAGCTSDIDEENYQEYSSFFWAAIAGETRTGQAVARPDYDGDGSTSFAEAHAYALLTSNTIDISVKTSDALLRAQSKLTADGVGGLLNLESPYAELTAAAAPAERAVLAGLIEQLGLPAPEPVAEANKRLEELKKERQGVEREKSRRRNDLRQVAGQISAGLKARWPELSNRWHPRVQEMLQQESPAVCEVVQNHPRFTDFTRMHAEVQTLSQRELEIDRKMAKVRRVLHVAESVALAANLERVATPEAVTRYHQLVDAEAKSLPEPALPRRGVAAAGNDLEIRGQSEEAPSTQPPAPRAE